MAPCYLLDLPFEIRRKIYHHVFADSPISFKIFEVDKKIFSWFRKGPLFRWVSTSPPPDPLIDTCRQIRYEALPELQSILRVSCEVTKPAITSKMTVIPLRNSFRNSIRFLHLIAHSEYTFWPQNEMQFLRRVLIESRYRVNVSIHDSMDGISDRGISTLIERVRSWHLDLLNEPEIPDAPGSWGLLKAISHPKRQFALEWRGQVTRYYIQGTGTFRQILRADEFDLHFNWDTMELLANEDDVYAIEHMNPFD